jgi:anion-transporting  ArsA/GET3 family ATPase
VSGPPQLSVDSLVDDRRIVVCCGAGGVGKTTTAAALALRAAERGRSAVVLTIDPAHRLAQSMGLSELDNTPRPVPDVDTGKGGSLDAMMLDMKRTFDEIVVSHTEPGKAKQILENPFYRALSSSFAGTQEYMAMEKLGQLAAERRWELIVVDTPPSRSALDFLDAPQRLSAFLDGRMIRLLAAPARAGSRAYLRVVSMGVGLFTGVLTRILGAPLLSDIGTFVAALETMFGGFRDRAERTYQLLEQPDTGFVVVATPERDALREAAYFVERLSEERMPLAGLIVNRMHGSGAAQLTRERSLAAAQTLEQSGSSPLAAAVLRLHAERLGMVARDDRLRERFTAAHPNVPQTTTPAFAADIHDLDGLRRVGDALAGELPPAAIRDAG